MPKSDNNTISLQGEKFAVVRVDGASDGSGLPDRILLGKDMEAGGGVVGEYILTVASDNNAKLAQRGLFWGGDLPASAPSASHGSGSDANGGRPLMEVGRWTGSRLKRLRASFDLTQAEMAEIMGIAQAGYARMERSRKPFRRTTMMALDRMEEHLQRTAA